jgi:GYF domain 2
MTPVQEPLARLVAGRLLRRQPRAMKLDVRHAGGELTVGSQKELLQLLRAGIVAPDDLVRREGHDEWVAASELPWLRGSAIEAKKDGRRLVWITVLLMVLGLCGALFVQSHVARRAPRSTFPGGAVRAVPHQVR